MGRYVLKNGKVILANKLIDNSGVVVEGKYIKDIFSGDNNISYGQDYQVIDVKGKYISPGFIDIHVHGGANSDFLDGSQDAIKDILKLHAQNGTTSLLATTLTCSDKDLFNALDNIRIAIDNDYDGAKILGVHLEGPYFSPKEKGAQDPKYIRNPVRNEYVSIIKKYPGMIKRVSAAPELKGSLEMAKYLSSKNILVSMAHTDATYDQAIEGVDNGFSHITHIYNSTSSVRSRDFYCQAGVVEAGLSLDELTVEVIADGRHIPHGILKLLYKTKGPDKLVLITDASRAAGMPPGKYKLGELDILVEDNVGMLPDKTSFAGSVATANWLAKIMYREVGISMIDVVKMLTLTPARLINESNTKGSLVKGKDADIIVFDDDIEVSLVIREGKRLK